MKIAITQRYGLTENKIEEYHVDKDFEEIFRELKVEIFPINPKTDLAEAIKVCGALLVTGGKIDINPRSYGEEPIKEVDKESEELDQFDFCAIKKFSEFNKPIWGICRGMQSINVCFGGSLHQDIKNHMLERNQRHSVKIEKESFLHDCYGKEELQVNSLHHQAVKKIAEGFRVVASSEDGIVEAIQKKNIIALQWHPEMMKDIEIFKNFINR